MGLNGIRSRRWVLALAASFASVLTGCGSRQPPASAPAPAETAVASVSVAHPLAVTSENWTPEAMEALLAPIALYPDPVLSQVLMAATNPQEVLDAGNWLIANPNLADKALDQAAARAGFTPPMRALMQFRQIVDQMCLKMGWTAELGQAFTNDQAGVLGAVQRLRRQAQDAGRLESSPQMKVETQDQGGEKAIVISPPSPQVVYVPQYDPMTAYAPASAIESSDYYAGEMVATGALAFGAGLIVGNVFDDDADDYYHHGYYYPNYGHGRYPPCPPRRYRPVYGHDFRPGHYYNRPPHYEDTLHGNNVLVVNNRSDGYWDNFGERPTGEPRANSVPSPITAARLYGARPAEPSAEASVPTGLGQTVRPIPERLPGNPGWQPDAGTQVQRPYAGEREPPRYGGGEPPSPYDGAQGQHPYAGEREPPRYGYAQGPRLQGGAVAQPAFEAAHPHEPHADGRPLQRDAPPPRQITAPSTLSAPASVPSWAAERSRSGTSMPPGAAPPPSRPSSPPPAAPSGNGNRGDAAFGSTVHPAERSAGARGHENARPSMGRNAGGGTQQQP